MLLEIEDPSCTLNSKAVAEWAFVIRQVLVTRVPGLWEGAQVGSNCIFFFGCDMLQRPQAWLGRGSWCIRSVLTGEWGEWWIQWRRYLWGRKCLSYEAMNAALELRSLWKLLAYFLILIKCQSFHRNKRKYIQPLCVLTIIIIPRDW